MARTDHHAAYAFTIYYIMWLFIFGNGEWILPTYLTFLIIIFGIFPDFDAIYWLIKKRGEGGISTDFQHHLYYWTHWPMSYIPLIILSIVSIIFNFLPEYFLIPVIGIYCGHFIFDSISCGDGLMWGKIPWKKNRYARFVNLLKNGSDGYHGVFWEARYRKTFISKVGNFVVIFSLVMITLFQIFTIIDYLDVPDSPGISGYYVMPIIFFIITLRMGLKKPGSKQMQEPLEGRYADYRINPTYINGLSPKNRKRHVEKYKDLLKKKGII